MTMGDCTPCDSFYVLPSLLMTRGSLSTRPASGNRSTRLPGFRTNDLYRTSHLVESAEHHVSTLGSHDSNSPFRHPLRLSGTNHGRRVEETEDDSFGSVGSQQPLLDASADVQKGPSLKLEDVGLPSDGAQDHEAAYRHRFCVDHGELEYLPGVAHRWMYAEDLELCNAEEALGTMLQSHRERPAKFHPLLTTASG